MFNCESVSSIVSVTKYHLNAAQKASRHKYKLQIQTYHHLKKYIIQSWMWAAKPSGADPSGAYSGSVGTSCLCMPKYAL